MYSRVNTLDVLFNRLAKRIDAKNIALIEVGLLTMCDPLSESSFFGGTSLFFGADFFSSVFTLETLTYEVWPTPFSSALADGD